MRWKRVIKNRLFQLKIDFVWHQKIMPAAPPDVVERSFNNEAFSVAGERACVLSAFDPVPQRDGPALYLLVEEPDGKLLIHGWSIQKFDKFMFDGSRSYNCLRKFSDYSDALDAWGMLRRGRSDRAVRSHSFGDAQ